MRWRLLVMRSFLSCLRGRSERKGKKTQFSGNFIGIHDCMEANKGWGICQTVEFTVSFRNRKNNWPKKWIKMMIIDFSSKLCILMHVSEVDIMRKKLLKAASEVERWKWSSIQIGILYLKRMSALRCLGIWSSLIEFALKGGAVISRGRGKGKCS